MVCLENLCENYPVNCYVVNNPPHKDAPYQFKNLPNITILDRGAYQDKELLGEIERLNPDLILFSNWNDKAYRAICRKFAAKIPVVLGIDNQWEGTLKQYLATFIAPWYLHPLCTHIWVPGTFQYELARRFGFSENKIMLGAYCANYPAFAAVYPAKKEKTFVRTLLYVGRFVDYKKPDWLLEAFMELETEGVRGWKLLMIGEGALKADLLQKAKGNVEIRGFMNPKELPALFGQSGVFCLPAEREHWGVVVHEAAAAGMPMLLSDTCGAGNAFLINAYNGFSYQTGNRQSFKDALRKMMCCEEDLLKKMGERSFQLSQRITHDTWTGTLMSVIHD